MEVCCICCTMGWIFFNDSERLRVKILGPWRASFSIESSVGNPRARELGSCLPRVLWTLQNWQSHWLPPFRWALPQKEWAEPRGRFCWALWDMKLFRPNSVPNYALLFQSKFLTLVGLCQVVTIVDVNCSIKKIFEKLQYYHMYFYPNLEGGYGVEPWCVEFFVLWGWKVQNILPGIIKLLCVSSV